MCEFCFDFFFVHFFALPLPLRINFSLKTLRNLFSVFPRLPLPTLPAHHFSSCFMSSLPRSSYSLPLEGVSAVHVWHSYCLLGAENKNKNVCWKKQKKKNCEHPRMKMRNSHILLNLDICFYFYFRSFYLSRYIFTEREREGLLLSCFFFAAAARPYPFVSLLSESVNISLSLFLLVERRGEWLIRHEPVRMLKEL